jgi:hypothetical protein
MAVLQLSRDQAVAYRLDVNHLTYRLPSGSVVTAARYGLQDTAPRDALLGLYARMSGTGPGDWQDDRLIQTYCPRRAVYLLPRQDFGIFTLGTMPFEPDERRRIESMAAGVCRELDGRELRGARTPGARTACRSGRIALRWTTSALWMREVDRPEIDLDDARRELCRRHLRAFAPSTPRTYAWWSDLRPADADRVWQMLGPELLPVSYEGHDAWVLAEDEERIRRPADPGGVRFLVPSDLRLLGRDRHGLFVGPGLRALSPLHDSFHPGGVLVDGAIRGTWGRRGGRLSVRLDPGLPGSVRDRIEAEGLGMPIPGTTVSVTLSQP